MLFTGIVISAVAMFLGIITKLPQGGGGLANNLMILGFFLPAPPLPPLPTPNRILFDLETAIAENQIFYLRNPVVTSNGTQGPMPRPFRKLPSAVGSSNAPADNHTFAFPTFASFEFSLPPELTQFWGSIGTSIMVLMVLCLPWLVIKKMSLLTGPALQAASKPRSTGFGGLVAQIEPLNPLFEDLRIIISEHNRAFADLRSITKEAREAEKKAAERDAEKEEELKRLRAERNDASTMLGKEKERVAKLEEERDGEVDRHREEMSSQIKVWTKKEKKWEEKNADDKKRHVEALDSLNMSRERERESWRKQVEDLEEEKKGEREAFGIKIKKILEKKKKEKEAWKEEREVGVVEKEKLAREKKELEDKRDEEKKHWDEANDRAQRRIADLEEETQKLKDEAAERQKKGAEDECQKRAQEGARKTVAKLEEEVLNGRKLIEDLQTDKRVDRQLVLELRAQLVRPTHATPPSHMNPLRFGGSAPPFMGPPAIAGPSAFPYASRPALPIMNLPSSGFTPPTSTPLPSPRPIVRFPPRPPPTPARLPTPASPPPNAPKGPKSWTPDQSKGPKDGQ